MAQNTAGIALIDNILNKEEIVTPIVPKQPQGSDIIFENVSFGYEKELVLNNISFIAPTGKVTALVGASEAGKSTIALLVARFWDIESGAVKLAGKDIREYDVDYLLSKISVVFQDVYLFNDTILNNIRMAKPKASIAEIQEVCRRAHCHEFIENMPDKYNTIVGESGSTLSGGEKQRISIARAILKDAPIILLDEATASLDPENELYIQEAINDLIKNKTVIVIAHRLNTVAGADQIIVLNDGSNRTRNA